MMPRLTWLLWYGFNMAEQTDFSVGWGWEKKILSCDNLRLLKQDSLQAEHLSGKFGVSEFFFSPACHLLFMWDSQLHFVLSP